MIGVGKFQSALADAARCLSKYSLLVEQNENPRYPSGMPSDLRKLPYREMWSHCVEKRWYNFRLTDGSIMQFKFDESYLSYNYIQTPLEAMSFEDFAAMKYGDGWEEAADYLAEEYDVYLGSDLAERSVTPIRFDYEPKLYRAGLHPAAHFHFGSANDVRVCVTKVLNPASFVLFILRHAYPSVWEKLLEEGGPLLGEARRLLQGVDGEFLQERDNIEIQLS